MGVAAALGGPVMISMAGPLAVILALLGAAVLLARRRGQGRAVAGFAGTSPISIVAVHRLGWQSTVLIIEAQGQRFLVASGRAGISALGALGARPSADAGGLDE